MCKVHSKMPCMKCGMVGRHLDTPHWKCPIIKKDNLKMSKTNSDLIHTQMPDLEYIRTHLQLARRIDMDAELVYNALLIAIHGEYEKPIQAFADAVIDMN